MQVKILHSLVVKKLLYCRFWKLKIFIILRCPINTGQWMFHVKSFASDVSPQCLTFVPAGQEAESSCCPQHCPVLRMFWFVVLRFLQKSHFVKSSARISPSVAESNSSHWGRKEEMPLGWFPPRWFMSAGQRSSRKHFSRWNHRSASHRKGQRSAVKSLI